MIRSIAGLVKTEALETNAERFAEFDMTGRAV
jgi:hypothetical protein